MTFFESMFLAEATVAAIFFALMPIVIERFKQIEFISIAYKTWAKIVGVAFLALIGATLVMLYSEDYQIPLKGLDASAGAATIGVAFVILLGAMIVLASKLL